MWLLILSVLIIQFVQLTSASDNNTTYNQILNGIIDDKDGLNDDQKKMILQLHNHYRSNVYPTAANMQKLIWDDILENITTSYVDKCQLAHNKQRHQLYDRLSNNVVTKKDQQHIWVGENIAWGSGMCTRSNGTSYQCGDIFEGIKRWLQQSQNYNYDRNKCVDKCSLYTQMIWAETNKMACAAKKCQENKTILICNYIPGGNIPESQPYIKGDTCSQCDETHPNCENALCVANPSSNLNGIKKVEIIKTSDSQPVQLHDCQSVSFIYTTSDSMIHVENYNENSTPLQFEVPFNGEETIIKYFLCFDIIWAITETHTLLARYLKKDNDWVRMTFPEPVDTISCVNYEVIWILSNNGNLFVRHLSEIPKMNNQDWWKLPNGIELFKSITCGEGSCWGVTTNNETFSRTNINRENPFGNYWKPNSIQFQNVTSNKQNILIGTMTNNTKKFKIFPSKGDWNELNKTSLNNLVFCADGVVELLEDVHRFKRTSNDDFFQIKPTVPQPFPNYNKGDAKIVTNSEDIALFNKLPFSVDAPENQEIEPEHKITIDSMLSSLTTTESPKEDIEFDSRRNNKKDSFEEISTPVTQSIPELQPIDPQPTQDSQPIINTNPVPEFHLLDGFKLPNDFQTQHEASKLNVPLCCSLADSVCPDLSNGCDAYIVCNGHNSISKRCDIGNVFDPALNICVPKDQTRFFCDTPSVPLMYDTNMINPITIAPIPISNDYYQPMKREESSQIFLDVAPNVNAPPPANPPIVSDISNDVRWSNFDINVHNYYIQPRVSIEKNESRFGILREAWFNLGTSPSLDYLYNNSRYPDSPDEFLILDSFEAPPNAGDGYGQRLSTYFRPNVTGEYIFFMSCDNECEFRLSEDETENHLNTIISLRRGHSTNFRQTNKYPTAQKSKPVEMKKNKLYLLQATMKEGTVVDHLSISIQYPDKSLDDPARFNLLLVPERNNSTASNNSNWNSDIGKKNLVANKYLKRNKINKRKQ